MAAKVESDTAEKTNTVDPARAEKLIAQMERINEDFLAHKMAYVASCAPFQKRRADKIQEASDFGIPKAVFKAKIKEREFLRKAEHIADDFDEDAKESFEELSQALGGLADMPLGKAAAKMDVKDTEAGKKPRTSRKAPSPDAAEADEDSKDVRPAFLKRSDADRAADIGAENGKAIADGIKPLH